MTKLYEVQVQHENFEFRGKTLANIINLGTVEADSPEEALAVAKTIHGSEHAPSLLMIGEVK